MATIRTAIQVNDMMSQQFRAMNMAMATVIDSFQALQDTTSNAIDVSALEAAQRELQQVEANFNQIEQEIRQAEHAQNRMNNEIREGSGAADGLLGKLSAIAATYLGFQSGQAVIGLSDEMTNTTARLDLMNDNLQTTVELQEMIFQSAKATYTPYQQTADMVGKLGMQASHVFDSNQELIAFTEQINKTFSIAGTSAEGVASTMLQLTQTMASGVLQGEELNAILDSAQPIVANIQKYMENVMDIDASNIKKLASEGVITAEIIKNAMFYMADETNAAFASMPVTFGQLWMNFQSDAFKAFQPVLQQLNDIANNEKFQNTLNGIVGSFHILSNVAMSALSVIMTVGGFFYDNWSTWGPLIFFIAGAFGALTFALIATKIATWSLNTAILASPLFWIPALIIGIIAVVYYAIGAINHFAGTSISATGLIAGAFLALGAIIANAFIYLWNIVVEALTTIYNVGATVSEGLVNVFSGDLDAINRMFVQLGDNVLGILESIARGMDFVFGTHLASGVASWRSGLDSWSQEHLGENKIKIDRLNAADFQLKTIDTIAAYNTGYNWGSGAEEFSLADFRHLDEESMKNTFDYSSILDNVALASKDTAGNTKKMADSIDMSAEDLKYMRDLAEQEAVNQFTTAEISIDMSGMSNSINSELDLDGVVSYLEEKVYETMTVAAEGVHE